MADTDDIGLVRSIYEAMADADFGRLFGFLDESVVITQDPALPWGGEWTGHDGFANFGIALTSNIESKVKIEAVFAADGDVIQFGRTRGTVRANGNEFDIAEVHRWTVRDGLAIRGHFSIDTAAMLKALGSTVLASTDWVAIASVGTAVATLILAIATFSSVRSSNRTARAAEQSLAAQLWPLLAPTRPEDPEQKIVFRDGQKLVVGGGRATVEATDDAVYFLISVRNVGPGLAVLDQWWFGDHRMIGAEPHADESSYRRLTRDQYIPSGEIGFLQAAIRDQADPDFAAAKAAVAAHEEMTVDVLYTDHLGNQRTITRFVLNTTTSGGWYPIVPRHWYLDRPDPRPHDD